MANKLQISIQILQEATADLIAKLKKAKNQEMEIMRQIDQTQAEQSQKDIQNKLQDIYDKK